MCKKTLIVALKSWHKTLLFDKVHSQSHLYSYAALGNWRTFLTLFLLPISMITFFAIIAAINFESCFLIYIEATPVPELLYLHAFLYLKEPLL